MPTRLRRTTLPRTAGRMVSRQPFEGMHGICIAMTAYAANIALCCRVEVASWVLAGWLGPSIDGG